MKLHALIVEDDPNTQNALAELVQIKGFEVSTAGSIAEAKEFIQKHTPDLALIDLRLPDGSGLRILDDIENVPTEVVVITGVTDLETAVEAMRQGALNYLTKPVDVSKLKGMLDEFIESANRRSDSRSLRQKTSILQSNRLVYEDDAMKYVIRMIERVATTEAPVMIIGESGTGKELVAQMVHENSARAQAVFLAVNCGAIAPNLIESELFGHERGSFTGARGRHHGYFEQAAGGTLFLDEITEMPIELQVKLLRVLETGKLMRVGGSSTVDVDVRIVAATNRRPDEAITDGRLRQDLYYRLNVFPIELPPLRERQRDVVCLSNYFLGQFNEAYETAKTFTESAVEHLCAHHWPGNVRELRNAVYRAFILADDLIDSDVIRFESRDAAGDEEPKTGDLSMEVGTSIAEAERRLILATLGAYNGNKKKTARVLGVSLKTLYNRLNDLKVEVDPEEAEPATAS